jgi:hypothetical protein
MGQKKIIYKKKINDKFGIGKIRLLKFKPVDNAGWIHFMQKYVLNYTVCGGPTNSTGY